VLWFAIAQTGDRLADFHYRMDMSKVVGIGPNRNTSLFSSFLLRRYLRRGLCLDRC
jgi:hypothetical protein